MGLDGKLAYMASGDVVDVKTHKIVGSDIAHAVPLTLIAGLGHWWLGSINFAILGPLLVGSIPGIVIGSIAARFTPENALRIALAIMKPSLNVAALRALKPEHLSQGAGMINFARQLGGAFGVTLLSVTLDRRTLFHGNTLTATQTAGNSSTTEVTGFS